MCLGEGYISEYFRWNCQLRNDSKWNYKSVQGVEPSSTSGCAIRRFLQFMKLISFTTQPALDIDMNLTSYRLNKTLQSLVASIYIYLNRKQR